MSAELEGQVALITDGTMNIGPAAAGLILMSKLLAREFGRCGVQVNCIATSVVPDAPVRWPMAEDDRMGPRLRERMMFEVSRWHIADLVAHLAGKGGDAITGQTISVNGGISFPG